MKVSRRTVLAAVPGSFAAKFPVVGPLCEWRPGVMPVERVTAAQLAKMFPNPKNSP